MDKKIIMFIIFGVALFIVSYIVSTQFVELAYVSGDSMYPTYKNDDIVFINKKYKSIERDDIVLAKKNNIVMIKRVIGIENDKILIKDGILYVNDEVYEKYKNIEYDGIVNEELILGPNEYFVLGDNINKSIDSRYKEIGIIKKSQIIGIVY